MAARTTSALAHWLRNLSLILLSLIFLPLSTIITILSLLSQKISESQNAEEPGKQKTILVTGVSMTKGLTILQLLAKQTGHRLVGADTSALSPARVSRYCSKFCQLPFPDPRYPAQYIQAMLDVVERESVDIWISCSGVSSAMEDAQVKHILERRTKCKAIQFNPEITRTLHEKDEFIKFIREECKLTVPETVEVTTHEEAMEVMFNQSGSRSPSKLWRGKEIDGGYSGLWWSQAAKKYILKPIGVDDAHRADMTLLPFSISKTVPSPEDATRDYVEQLPISRQTPWLVQEYIKGQEFCTHSLVIDGEVKAFVACPSAELLMHYEALPSPEESRLTAAMLDFTKSVAGVLQQKLTKERSGGLTGHMSFDFLVKNEDLAKEDGKITLYPIECNPRAHTAVVLMKECPEAMEAYLDVLDKHTNGHNDKTKGHEKNGIPEVLPKEPVYPAHSSRYYWLPHDFITLLLLPILSLILALLPSSLATTVYDAQKLRSFAAQRRRSVQDIKAFFSHLLIWRDGAFMIEDPLPALWLYHVYWPGQLFDSLWTGKRWSRINVSTGKMFGVE